MELGKEATLVVQIPALLLPTQGSWTVVFLPVLGSQLWDPPPPRSKCKPSAGCLAV